MKVTWKGIVATVVVALGLAAVTWGNDDGAAGIVSHGSTSSAGAVAAARQASAGGLTAAETTALLAAHNAWRAKYGVPPLVWDAKLARYAQQFADLQAKTGRNTHRSGPYGENLAWTGGTPRTPKWIVDQWGSEVNAYNLETNICAPTKSCGHFSQLVWKRTRKVGCARATGSVPPQGLSWKGKNFYYVCNYNPRGNLAGLTFGS